MSGEYKRLKDIVETHILDYLPDIDQKSKTLYEAMKYSLVSGGKRMRPVLMLAACELYGGNVDFALPFAVAAEYIQTYSLIHDDLPAMDNDDFRRGQPSNHKVFGEDMAILAGDGLLSAAYEVMTKDMLMYMDDPALLNRKVRACFELSKGTGVRGMVAGQVADVEAENTLCSEEMLDFIHTNKTAAFIKSCMICGAYLGGAGRVKVEEAARFGEYLGLAFQIADDILDSAEFDAEGKCEDESKSTYPSLYGLEKSRDKTLSLLEKAKDLMKDYYDNAEVFNYVVDDIIKKISNV